MRLKFWQRQFQLAADTPGVWVLQSRRLKCAADTIFREYGAALDRIPSGADPTTLEHLQTIGPATLLYGLSLENLLKGVLIKIGGSRISNWKLSRWSGSGHDLVALARDAGISLDEVECDLLARLSAYVEWAGRYPIPLSAQDMPLEQRNVSPEWFPLPLQVSETEAFAKLYGRMEGCALR